MEFDKSEPELIPILKDETKCKKKPKSVKWGYKHFLEHDNPNFENEKEQIEEFERETRGSTLSKRKSYLRDLKSNLKEGLSSKPFKLEESEEEPVKSPFFKKESHQEVAAFHFGSSPNREEKFPEEVTFAFPSLEQKEDEVEDEVEFSFAFPSSPAKKNPISAFGIPFGK